jgi:hypothetical protein
VRLEPKQQELVMKIKTKIKAGGRCGGGGTGPGYQDDI